MSKKDWLKCSGCGRDLDVSFPWGAGADSVISCGICGWASEDDGPTTRIKEMSLDEVADHVESLNALRDSLFFFYKNGYVITKSDIEELYSRLDRIIEDCREEDV